jgi:predicted nucleic acid-binding protein
VYLDASAALKLILQEAESADLRRVAVLAELSASELLFVEIRRTAARVGADPDVWAGVLRGVAALGIASSQLARAGRIASAPGRCLGTLDAIHLASALALGEDEMLTYDAQLAAAAARHGLAVVSPGRPHDWWV